MIRFLLTIILSILAQISFSQSSPSTLNGSVYNLTCGQACTNIQFQLPHLKEVSSYVLTSIPYNPYDFKTQSGIEDASLYTDDRYSFAASMPFSVCFYNKTFNQVVIGSNGLITFDIENASCGNGYQINNAIPSAVGTICSASQYYPKSSIMAAYTDLDPTPSMCPLDKKIEWRVEGLAPTRRFVVSYYNIGTFGNGSYSASGSNCNSLHPNTMQIVLYESAGYFDVFIKEKTCNSSTTGGRAILGIQDSTRTQATFHPTRNNSVWSALNEGWRFIPSSGTSRFVSSELFDMNNNFVKLGDTTTTTSGILDIKIPNVCPPSGIQQYVVKTTFFDCLSASNFSYYDTVTINTLNTFPANLTSTPASCGLADGVVTVTTTGGTAPYQYAINGGAFQSSNIFPNLSAGIYNISVIDNQGCNFNGNITVGSVTNITATTTNIPTSCPTVNNGRITVNTPTGGTAPYTYSINGGPNQVSNVFNGLAPATYTITFKDINGCTGTTTATITQGSSLTAISSIVNPPCSGINNGSITILPITGSAPFTYTLNGGTPQLSNTFNGLAVGTYSIVFNDAIGCQGRINVTLVGNTPLNSTLSFTDVLCFGTATGTVTITPNGGISPYTYSSDGGVSYQILNTFNFPAGAYTIRVKDNVGCVQDLPVTITEPSILTASNTITSSTCNGNDGSIDIATIGGTLPYQYSIDNGITYLNGSVFIVGPGNYPNIKVKDANGCIASTSAIIPLLDTMRLFAGADTSICVGSSYTMQPQSNAQTSIWAWTPKASLNDSIIANAIATPLDTTQYILTAQWGLCTRKDTMQINVLHKPIAHAGNDTMICYKTSALLRGWVSNISGAVNYLWTPSNTVTPANNRFATAKPDTSQLYTLTIKDNYGCNFSVSDDVMVIMQPPVPAYAGNDTNAIVGVPHQLLSSGGVQYLWSPAATLNNATTQNPLATLFNDTYFTVEVTDIAGCKGYDDVFIKAYQGPTYYIANAFTPNNDGLNDIFKPKSVGIKSTEYFRVFNRYGQMMYETNKWNKGWDGTYNGQKQPGGVYIWYIKGIDENGKKVELKGTVMLVK